MMVLEDRKYFSPRPQFSKALFQPFAAVLYFPVLTRPVTASVKQIDICMATHHPPQIQISVCRLKDKKRGEIKKSPKQT